jgi:flagellar biosynthesis protein FliR
MLSDAIVVWLLVLCRWAPLFLSVGITPMQWLPATVRLVVMMSMATLTMFMITETNVAVPVDLLSVILAMAREFIVGVLLLFSLQLIFVSLSFWGRLLDQQIGFTAAGILNPASKEQEPLLGSLFMLVGFVIFFSLNLHHQWLFVVFGSYQWLPIFSDLNWHWFWLAGTGMSLMFVVAMLLFMPVIAGLWMFDIWCALISRTMPQMNMYFVAMPLKIGVGLFLISLVVGVLDNFVMKLHQTALQLVNNIFS